jgi:glyoxylase-like metal-dependent hydrolase (beta-lactamase superfamily II)
MNFEIDVLPVGESSKPGDAIIVRYAASTGGYYLIVIDGGSKESGENLICHIHKHYGDKVMIHHAILTHCDADHACGFREIVQNLDVRRVWMHIPWFAAASSLQYFADKSLSPATLAQKIQREYDLISEIYEIATRREIPIEQPFAGKRIGPFTILSPYSWVYDLLLPQFDRTPDPDQAAMRSNPAITQL